MKATIFSMTEEKEFIIKLQTRGEVTLYLKKSEIEAVEIIPEFDFDDADNAEPTGKCKAMIHTKSGKVITDSNLYDSESEIIEIYL